MTVESAEVQRRISKVGRTEKSTSSTRERKTDKDTSATRDPEGEAWKAASKGELKKLHALVFKGFDINSKNYDGRTALHLAASEGFLSVVEFIVDRMQADTQVTDRWGGTPLDDAIRHGHKEVAAFLTKKGASVGKMSCLVDDAVLLCNAAARGENTCVSGLVKRKVDINLGDYDRRTALHLAASEGQLGTVKYMIEKLGADKDVKDRWGGTPIDDAIRGGHTSTFMYLEKRGAQRGKTALLNAGDATDLCAAASSGDVSGLRKLVENGSNVNAGDYDNRTAMHLAASEGLMLVVKCLVEELEADVNVVDRWGGTPLDDAMRSKNLAVAEYLRSKDAQRGKTAVYASDGEILVKAGSCGDLPCVAGLVQRGVDVNASNYDRRTALHLAASTGDLAMVMSLVESYGADVSVEDAWGITPLDEAIHAGHKQVCEFLTRQGAGRGSAASIADQARAWGLLAAAAQGDVATLRDLHLQGASTSTSDWDGRTALHLAAAKGRLPAVQCMVEELSANVNATDIVGCTALDAARVGGHHQVAAYLASRGAAEGKVLTPGSTAAGDDGRWTFQTWLDMFTCKSQADKGEGTIGEIVADRIID